MCYSGLKQIVTKDDNNSTDKQYYNNLINTTYMITAQISANFESWALHEYLSFKTSY